MNVILADACQPVIDPQKLLFTFYKVARFAVTISFLIHLVFSRYLTLQPASFFLEFSYCTGLVDIPDFSGVREYRQVLDA